MSARYTRILYQHHTGVTRIGGREESYKRRILDVSVAYVERCSRLASYSVHCIIYIVASAFLHHSYQHLSHLLGYFFAANSLFKNHRTQLLATFSIHYLAAEKRLDHLSTVGKGIIERNQLQRRHGSRVPIAKIQEISVGFHIKHVCLRLRSL